MTSGAHPPRRVVVVGDVVLDRDLLGRTERICPDAPVPVVDVEQVRESPGGAGLTALLCRAPDVEVTLVAPFADDAAGRRLTELLRAGGVTVLALDHCGPTRTKTRVRCAGQSLLRLDEGGPGMPVARLGAPVRRALEDADLVLVSDYGAGTTAHPQLRRLITALAGRQRPHVCWDPHPRGGTPVAGCTLVTPNLAESRAAAADPAGTAHVLAGVLRGRWRTSAVAVTAGDAGAWLATSATEPYFVPVQRRSDGDPCGAGDRFAASAALAVVRGAVPSEAVATAVRDASDWVAGGGAEGFRARQDEVSEEHGDLGGLNGGPAELAGAVGARGREGSAGPGVSQAFEGTDGWDDASALVAGVRARGGALVATGGCFDVLHAGHVACLEAARALGDGLVVLLNSDDSVRRLKGPGRPLQPAQDRARVLLGLRSVDAVVVFDEDDPCRALEQLRPDVWAKGGDYDAAALPEAGLVRGWGGRVVLLPYLAGRSTTAILQDIR